MPLDCVVVAHSVWGGTHAVASIHTWASTRSHDQASPSIVVIISVVGRQALHAVACVGFVGNSGQFAHVAMLRVARASFMLARVAVGTVLQHCCMRNDYSELYGSCGAVRCELTYPALPDQQTM